MVSFECSCSSLSISRLTASCIIASYILFFVSVLAPPTSIHSFSSITLRFACQRFGCYLASSLPYSTTIRFWTRPVFRIVTVLIPSSGNFLELPATAGFQAILVARFRPKRTLAYRFLDEGPPSMSSLIQSGTLSKRPTISEAV